MHRFVFPIAAAAILSLAACAPKTVVNGGPEKAADQPVASQPAAEEVKSEEPVADDEAADEAALAGDGGADTFAKAAECLRIQSECKGTYQETPENCWCEGAENAGTPGSAIGIVKDEEKKEVSWGKYTNAKLGFSIEYPEETYIWDGACSAAGEGWFEPRGAYVPLRIFEQAEMGRIELVSEYTYLFEGEERVLDDGMEQFPHCSKNPVTLSVLKEYPGLFGWEIDVRSVKDEAELGEYVAERYGEGCKVDALKPADQEGVSYAELNIGAECQIDYLTVVLFKPDAGKTIAMDLGRDCSYFLSPDYEECADADMVASVKFE